jgi:hypothetical protein
MINLKTNHNRFAGSFLVCYYLGHFSTLLITGFTECRYE